MPLVPPVAELPDDPVAPEGIAFGGIELGGIAPEVPLVPDASVAPDALPELMLPAEPPDIPELPLPPLPELLDVPYPELPPVAGLDPPAVP